MLSTAVEPQADWKYVGTSTEQANRPFCLPVFGIRNVDVDVRHLVKVDSLRLGWFELSLIQPVLKLANKFPDLITIKVHPGGE